MKKIIISLFLFCSPLAAYQHPHDNAHSHLSSSTVVAIAANGSSEDTDINVTCGKARFFHIYVIDNNNVSSHEVIQNQWFNQSRGSGYRIANMLHAKNVNYLICQQTGPNITDHLDHCHIEVIYDSGKVTNALEKFINQRVKQ